MLSLIKMRKFTLIKIIKVLLTFRNKFLSRSEFYNSSQSCGARFSRGLKRLPEYRILSINQAGINFPAIHVQDSVLPPRRITPSRDAHWRQLN